MVSNVLPFANEVANVLTSSGLSVFAGLYEEAPDTLRKTLSKTFIDAVALSGIILTSAMTSEKHGVTAGAIQGISIVLIAFVLPNLTFHPLTHKFCGGCGSKQKIAFGFLLILILFLIEKYAVHPLAHSFSKHTEEH